MSDLIQGSDEWSQCRIGKVTASRIADILATTKSGPAASRKNYMSELIVEILTGQPYEHYISKEMIWGTENEPIARDEYGVLKDVIVEQVGFIDHPTIEMCGSSPDGLVRTDGCVEIKCPNTATHIDTVLSGKADSKYYPQMQWEMECTNRAWCDFVSYDPRMPSAMQLYVVRVPRDEAFLEEAREEVIKFRVEMYEKLHKLQGAFASRLTA